MPKPEHKVAILRLMDSQKRFLTSNSQGFAATVSVLAGVLLFTAIAGVFTLRFIAKKSPETRTTQTISEEPTSNTAPTSSPQANPVAPTPSSNPATTTPVANPAFNAEQFYNQVQNGMSSKQVEELAGESGDCAQTAVWPASGNVSCTWQDSQLIVTVNFTKDGVVGKAKRAV